MQHLVTLRGVQAGDRRQQGSLWVGWCRNAQKKRNLRFHFILYLCKTIKNSFYTDNIMNVKELIEKLNLKIFCGEQHLEREIKGGYVSDLLSDVMGFAQEGHVWMTLQTHKNVIAIASLKELACVILVKGFEPDPDMLEQAKEEEIPILGTDKQTFEISGLVYSEINK